MGTTTACYFASLHMKASVILGEKAAKFGQRAFVGKLNMNFHREDGYYESTVESVANTRQFIRDIVKIGVSFEWFVLKFGGVILIRKNHCRVH